MGTAVQAVRQRGTDQGLLLQVGKEIIPSEEDEFPKKKFEGDLKKLWKQANEVQLPKLPTGVIPGGWDALGRPWALIDCPAEKVPRIPSAHGTSRVTIATLVSFPSEPFFFVNLVHLDGIVRVKNKVGHATYRGLQGELNEDQCFQDLWPSEIAGIWGQRSLPRRPEGTTMECIPGGTLGELTQPAGSRG